MRPEPLRHGDVVALVAPAGPVRGHRVAAAARVLTRRWGLTVRVGAHALRRDGYLAGTDEERLADLNAAFADRDVRGIICLRGGYGVQRIVDAVDYDAVRRDPKLVMGFSDITALHAALWRRTGLATVHGPTGASLPLSEAAARTALMTTDPVVVRGRPGRGRATGVLLGGNLTMLAADAGTPGALDLRGAILLVEDVGEPAYKVDRMLVQLRRSGVLDGVAGFAVGQFSPAEPRRVIDEHLGASGVPLLRGLPIGHGRRQVAVGLGVPACLDAAAGTLTVQPAAAVTGRARRPGRRSSAAAARPATAGR
ncbi:LD-carboxypeptidase [Actinoplanes sp. DH11]|uniref:S66 peptidase family protein n=1 Tax=Actinoplanes sp. DH11 TaxID=2857011 RepID=UPI001E44A6A2|nr:LD-carboxypeptidase [Actinoplanes sp. DH11]